MWEKWSIKLFWHFSNITQNIEIMSQKVQASIWMLQRALTLIELYGRLVLVKAFFTSFYQLKVKYCTTFERLIALADLTGPLELLSDYHTVVVWPNCQHLTTHKNWSFLPSKNLNLHHTERCNKHFSHEQFWRIKCIKHLAEIYSLVKIIRKSLKNKITAWG